MGMLKPKRIRDARTLAMQTNGKGVVWGEMALHVRDMVGDMTQGRSTEHWVLQQALGEMEFE